MKELSIEEKAKRYDKAIERAEGLIDFCSDSELKTLEYVFPELKESEDEKIRKEIVSAINIYCSEYLRGTKVRNDMLTWFKKQEELVNSLSKGLDNAHERIDELIQKNNKLCIKLEKQGEQKPTDKAWSEEDETNSYHLKTLLENLAKDIKHVFRVISDDDRDKYTAWLESIKDRVQPKQEWSEEDKKCIRLSTDIIDSALRAGFCVQLDRDRCVDWLKSLKQRCTWKPSEEQMNALSVAVKHGQTDDPDALKKLLEQLKKLKEHKLWKE